MEITIQLDEEQERLIANEGDVPLYIEGLVAAECKRLWHIERSKPKAKVAKPPGPRRLTPIEREVREKGDFLRNVYIKLREFYAKEYPDFLVTQEQELEAAIEALDLDTITRFVQEQPWRKRT